MLHALVVSCWLVGASACALAQTDRGADVPACGTVVDLSVRNGAQLRYSWVAGQPLTDSAGKPTAAVAAILLVGGGGWVDIDQAGCPQRLKGNILVRTAPRLRAAGVTTVLVDAPSDWPGDDGLAGFRIQAPHAADLGRVVADIRARTGARTVWLIGHSRGSLSAANAAARLSGTEAPDGVVLASAMLVGENSKRKPWVAQTVFDTDIKNFRGALLLVGHAADNCVRSVPEQMDAVLAGANAARAQAVRVTGGPRPAGRAPSLSACEVHEPHDFVEQDGLFADGVLRFIQGGRF